MASTAHPTHSYILRIDDKVLGKRKKSAQSSAPWTNKVRCPGQATFDLGNDMKQVPFAKSSSTNVEASAAGEQGFTTGSGSSCGAIGDTRCACDVVMRELNEMHEDARERTSDGG